MSGEPTRGARPARVRLPLAMGVAALGLALGSCAQPEPAAGPYEGESPRDADQLWTPSQEELDGAAAREIDETNADAELERLRREIEQED